MSFRITDGVRISGMSASGRQTDSGRMLPNRYLLGLHFAVFPVHKRQFGATCHGGPARCGHPPSARPLGKGTLQMNDYPMVRPSVVTAASVLLYVFAGFGILASL